MSKQQIMNHQPASLREIFISVFIWISGLLFFVPAALMLTLMSLIVHPKRFDRLSRLFCKLELMSLGVQTEYSVHPDIQADQPYFFLPNHTNHLDFLFFYNATPHFKQGVEHGSHFKYPVYGWLMKTRGTIPVYPGSKNQIKRITAQIKKEIDQGHSVLGFPEGTRTLTGRVGRFKKGLFYAAVELGIPVVPVAVTGAWDIMHKPSYVVHPFKKVKIHVLPPVPVEGLTQADVPQLAKTVKQKISAIVDGPQ